MHVSLCDPETNQNLFARSEPDPNAPYEDIKHLSDLGRHFLAGLIEGLPYVMPIFAPTINSYKRLVENFWAPVTVSWGLEHRAASIRLIAPPTASPKSTRFEVRVPGADTNPYLVLATILALGWRGVEKKLEIPIPPLGKGEDVGGAADKGVRLAKSLREATDTFKSKDSIAREVFGDDFVDHFAGTREHELRLWDEAVTDWYVDLSLLFGGMLTNSLVFTGSSSAISRLFENRTSVAMVFNTNKPRETYVDRLWIYEARFHSTASLWYVPCPPCARRFERRHPERDSSHPPTAATTERSRFPKQHKSLCEHEQVLNMTRGEKEVPCHKQPPSATPQPSSTKLPVTINTMPFDGLENTQSSHWKPHAKASPGKNHCKNARRFLNLLI